MIEGCADTADGVGQGSGDQMTRAFLDVCTYLGRAAAGTGMGMGKPCLCLACTSLGWRK